jgi:hypothetical protein
MDLRFRGDDDDYYGEHIMRAEALAHADKIKQAIDLLRRFL